MNPTETAATRRIVYDDRITRDFVFWSVLWGLIGMLVGLFAALQLSFHQLNFDLPWTTFGRIRPLHTNAVIFALVGNMMFAGIYYSTQRLLKTRMASDLLSRIHLWGWQAIILGAALTLPLGITQSKEYSELEWFLDIAVAFVWIVFAVNFFWTLKIRNERHLYVAIWFYIATILTIAILYVVNNLALPVTGTKSYGIFAGAQDALTQWWYGHNAVAFFLTTPILGIMYYFLPKAADRPVYSYRLSIIHFWALVFLYIWAGPHHLLYTALPDWAQSLGMLFSLMLWAPSWGGMLNGLLTLRGAWHLLRTDPVLKFFAAGVTFYGMATFEGPLLSIKSVNALAHYTDWIIGHVHTGALGWNGLMAAGLFYWLVPRIYGTKLHSRGAADLHFWIATFGILLYAVSMWIAGIQSGLMQRAVTDEGVLQYTQWAEITAAINPLYVMRSIGGGLFIAGWALMIWNLWKTARSGVARDAQAEVAVLVADTAGEPRTAGLVFGSPLVLSALGLACCVMIAVGNAQLAVVGVVALFGVCVAAAFQLSAAAKDGRFTWHSIVERRPLAFTLLVAIAVVAGGLIELLPGIVVRKAVPLTVSGQAAVAPYTPLELEGRDVYVREGCYTCHSQMVRPFRTEVLRYDPNGLRNDASRIEESMWDHPFQWGSKRTGPDLAFIGLKGYDHLWHFQHMLDPRSLSPGSVMPSYPWLLSQQVDLALTPYKLKSMRALGVPYDDADIRGVENVYRTQARTIVDYLAAQQVATVPEPTSELVALIAYLQRLGRNERTTDVGQAK
jgi:cytochrome c oxidase cbb3-type subunit I/II